MAPHVTNFLLGSFGIVAAVLLTGGSILLRWQKNRQRYELMRRALDNGTPLPKGPPLWLASRRQALSILACGVGLLIIGCGAWWLGYGVTTPAGQQAVRSTTAETVAALPFMRDVPPPRPPAPSPEMEAYRRAQERVAVGETALGCGVILTLLGVARLGFTTTEKRFAESNENL